MLSRSFLFFAALLLVFAFCGPFMPPAEAQAQTQKSSRAKTVKVTPQLKKKKAAITKKKSRMKAASSKTAKAVTTSQTQDARFAALVIDGNTGRVLYEKNASERRYPASLTKMMTLYLLFESLENGKIAMSSEFPVSAKAAGQPPTNIFLSPGDRITAKLAIEALIIRSANDVAMVVAEGLGGSQEGFARMMNAKARQLGMNETVFYNPSGLPDSRQMTTAQDLAKLGVALRRDFPTYFSYFSQQSFSHKGRKYQGHNRLLGRYSGADGIKTGYINASGFNLVTSVKRGNTYLVGVVMGGRTAAGRDQEMMNMLDRTFIQLAREQTEQKPVAAIASIQSREEKPTFAERREEKPEATQRPQTVQGDASWSIQIGAFPEEVQATSGLETTRQLITHSIGGAPAQIRAYEHRGRTYYRARFTGLTATQAREACGILSAQNRQCLMIRASN